jgi:NADPH:quinone reductase
MKALVAQELSGPTRLDYVDVKDPGSQSVFEFGVGELIKAGLRPPPPMRFPLAEGSAALQRLADGGVLGKVVLEP